jgi:YgiT-type zinc finger domain-containing protein
MECVHCKGNLIAGSVNYPVDLGDKFILIKEVPASICNQCGEYYLDDDIFIKVEDIVNHVKAAKFGIEIEVVNFKQSA